MSNEMNINGLNYLDLLKRRVVKPKPTFNIQINKNTKEKGEKMELEELEEELEEKKEKPIKKDRIEGIREIGEKKENPIIKFNDRRQSVDVDRELILARMGKFSNIHVVEKNIKLKNYGILGKDDSTSQETFKTPYVENLYDNIESNEPAITTTYSSADISQPKKIKRKFIIRDSLEPQEKVSEKVPEKIQYESQEEELPDELPDEESQESKEEEKQEESQESQEEEKKEETSPAVKKRGRKKKLPSTSEEESKEEEKTNKPPKKMKTTRKKYDEFRFGEQVIDKDLKINKKSVLNRLPKREKLVVKTSNYYMNNRKLYIQKISELFKPYKKELIESLESNSCDSVLKNTDFKLLTHQKVVRDYLNIYTPYRGLLIYHMLGSGKTCTSIAIAEGMKTQRPVVLMTPASLKTNFFYELKKCGDLMYRRNQYWEFINTSGKPEYVDTLSKVLLIPKDIIQKNEGAWLVDITKKEANFNTLSSEQQISIDQQLDMMIRSKYLDINYNGLTKKKFDEMTENMTKNPFDNCTVIIDEAHNFVSRIVNKVKKPKSISYILYDYLMKAENAKIVLVTGTPIINYPNELGILFNILRGYIKKWTFQLHIKNSAPPNFKVNLEEIMKIFKKEDLNTYDYLEYSGNKLIVTRNPFGFINTDKNSKKGKTGGDKEESNDMMDSLKTLFGGKKKNKTNKKIVVKNKKQTNKTKKNLENNGAESGSVRLKSEDSVRSQKNLNSYIVENNVIKKVKKDNEMEIEEEATIEYNDRVNQDLRKGGQSDSIADDYTGVTLDETGNITDAEFVSNIKKVLGKHHIEIIEAGSSFEEMKALPDDTETFINTFIDQDNIVIKNENTFKKRILGLSSYFRSTSETLMPSFVKTDKNENYHIVSTEMSEYQFSIYEKIRKEEADKEKTAKKQKKKQAPEDSAEKLFTVSSTYRIFSRASCNFAFPTPPGRPMPDSKDTDDSGETDETDEIDIDGINPENATEANPYLNEEDVESMKEDENKKVDYLNRIKNALDMIKYDPKKSNEEQFLNEENLKSYSPKFLKILQNIKDPENKGLHLLYSQFRTIEGIGIMKLILETNGYAEFKIKKNDSSGMWDIVEKEEDKGKPKFVLYTGTETAEQKEIIRNIYNSAWEVVPSSITAKLRQISSNNFYGEVIKMIMITSSGAEGINLKNTRFVHIVEPYWHMVRLEQVIGRARRICSHNDLPEEERTVKVFLYLSTFSEEQKTNKKNIEMMNRDISRIDGRPITTDENLFDISFKKQKINKQLLDSIKETAVDCNLYNPYNKEENLVCYSFGKVTSNSFASYPSIDKDLGEMEEVNIKKVKLKLKASKPINGVIYAIDPKTMNAYDMESYNRTLEGVGELELMGKIEKVGNQFTFTAK